jgi:hypothetical protein
LDDGESVFCLRSVSNQYGAGCNEGYPKPVRYRKPLSQEDDPENGNKYDAQLVYWGDARGIAQFQGTKVADP